MEDILMKEKDRILKEELANWKFTDKMKNQVLTTIQERKKPFKFPKIVFPTWISAALIILFFGGLYHYVIDPVTSLNGGQAIKEVPKNDSQTKLPPDSNLSDSLIKKEPVENPTSPVMSSLPNFTQVMNQFNDQFRVLIENDIDESNHKFKKLKTRQEFFERFSGITTTEAIKQYSDPFLKETPDGLYMVSQPRGLIYDKELPIDVKKINQQKYEVKQYVKKGESSVTRTITFEKINGKFLIIGIEQPNQ